MSEKENLKDSNGAKNAKKPEEKLSGKPMIKSILEEGIEIPIIKISKAEKPGETLSEKPETIVKISKAEKPGEELSEKPETIVKESKAEKPVKSKKKEKSKKKVKVKSPKQRKVKISKAGKKKTDDLDDEHIQRIMARLASEEKEVERVKVEARLISTHSGQQGVNVKIKCQILDDSFYAKAIKLFFNAGTEKFEEVDMEKINIDNFAIVLGNIPKEIQIVYFIQIRDKSGEIQQFPRTELIQSDGTSEEEPYYSFVVEPNGTISFAKEWDDSGLNACTVCGYMCPSTWDICPECRTPLYDTTQEVFSDAQKDKEKARQQMKEDAELSWEDSSDEAWRGLPECPNCGYTVQTEWTECPVCQFDLTSVKLEKTESYEEFMTEEEKAEAAEQKKNKEIQRSMKEKKSEQPDEPTWEDEDGIDIL